MRPCLFLAMGMIALSCSRDRSSSTSNKQRAGQSEMATTGNARCDMGERESGRCLLWGPSIIELIARPELYDGKRVRVIGFVNFEFEGNGLYVSREDWRQAISRNGVWIEPPAGFESDSGPAQRQPNQRYVIVEATFRAAGRGHGNMWSGTLEQVTRLDPWGRDPISDDAGVKGH